MHDDSRFDEFDRLRLAEQLLGLVAVLIPHETRRSKKTLRSPRSWPNLTNSPNSRRSTLTLWRRRRRSTCPICSGRSSTGSTACR
jgi:hypothetical protein